MKVYLKQVTSLSVYCLSVFVFSLLFSGNFYGGDQTYYRLFYKGVSEIGITGVLPYSQMILSTTEPVYPYLVYLAVKTGLGKDLFVAFSNAILVALCLLFLKRRSCPVHLAFFSILFSFYFLQLFFEVERLKFALIFVILSFLLKHPFLAALSSCFAILTHVQVAVIYVAVLFAYYMVPFLTTVIFDFRANKKEFSLILVFTLILTVCVVVMVDHIVGKLEHYAFFFRLNDFLKSVIMFFFVSFFISKTEIRNYALVSAPIIFSISFMSSDRLLVLLYFASFFFLAVSSSSRQVSYFAFLGYSLVFGLRGLINFFWSLKHGSWVYLF